MNCVMCSVCGEKVSNETSEDIIVRAFVECPECVEKNKVNSIPDFISYPENKPDFNIVVGVNKPTEDNIFDEIICVTWNDINFEGTQNENRQRVISILRNAIMYLEKV